MARPDLIQRRRTWILLGPILGLAVWLRFWRLDAGLPEVVYVDAFRFLREALRFVETGDWTPHQFQYPGLFPNLLAGLLSALGPGGEGFAPLLGRVVHASFGVGTVALVWVAVRPLLRGARGSAAAEQPGLGEVSGLRIQVLATLLAAVSVVEVSYARVVAVDAIVSFFMVAALVVLARKPERARSYALAGALAGLAIGTKPNGLLLLPFLALAALAAHPPGRAARLRPLVLCLLSGALAALVAFVITTPHILSHLDRYAATFERVMTILRSGQIGRVQGGWLDLLGSSTPTWEMPWLGTSILANHGPVLLVTGLGGVLLGLSTRFGFAPFLYGLYALAYLVVVSGPGRIKAVRFLMPMLPIFYVLAAWAVETLVLRRLRRGCAWAFGVVAAALLVLPLSRTLGYLDLHRRPSTHTLARRWVAGNLPRGAPVLLGPFFTNDLRRLPMDWRTIPRVGPRQYDLPPEVGRSPERDPILSAGLLERLRREGVRYLVLNSYFDDSFSPVEENLRYFPRSVAAARAFEERLAAEAKLLWSVRGFSAHRLGPDIRVYELRRP